MKFLVGNQLPGALCRLFVSFGCDSVHVMEVGLGSAQDAEIWRYACGNSRIVVTKDEDFLHLATRQLQGGTRDMGAFGELSNGTSPGPDRAPLAADQSLACHRGPRDRNSLSRGCGFLRSGPSTTPETNLFSELKAWGCCPNLTSN